ncbi:MAG TPA: BTAD domain-containing putative transcriptional regulator [Candidatus Sulfomarinibacteraceae bacterium]|nr:BTAD domain-containing putative transcriptional regulator [Candidatus Sulfomarinibacteraceae bacterium]
MSHIELRLLGPLEIWRDGRPVGGFRSQKTQALLAYLALTGQPVARAQLADLFWPNAPGDAARAELRRVLYNLNQRLPDLVKSDRQTLSFQRRGDAPDLDVSLDTDTFKQLAEGMEIAGLERATALYRGELLQGLYLEECAKFESWLGAQREAWQEKQARLLGRLADLYAADGDYDTALRAARRRLELDPWREEAHRRVMILLARSGRRSEALAQYETCRHLLQEELGVAPAARTTALYERLRASSSLIRHNLPPQPAPLIGREQELGRLLSLLTGSEARLITIVGPGGIGKTRLALHAARAAAGHFLDGVAHVSLETVTRPALLPGAIVDALAAADFIPAAGADRALGYLQRQLAEREILLLLDNMEHLLRAAPRLAELLQAAPGLKFLITSRERLNLSWERVFHLEGLRAPPPDAAAAWEAYGAARLFVEAARRATPGFQLTADNREYIARICRHVEGMPLALELAAAWTRVQSCAAIAGRLASDLDLLARPQRDRGPRQSNIRAAFDRSWQLLSAEEQAIFSRLGVFYGSFSVEAAQEVAGAGWQHLASLADKSLVRALPQADGSQMARFQLHELLRQYALERLAEQGETEAVRDDHCRYYTDLAQEQTSCLRGGEQKAALETMAREASNVEAAWAWAGRRGLLDALDAALEALFLFLSMRSRLEQGINLLAQTTGQLKGQEAAVAVRARVLARLAMLRLRRGEYDAAERETTTALELARRAEDGQSLAAVYLALARLAYNRGRYGRADEYGVASLALYRELDQRHGQALCLSVLGLTTVVQAKYLEADAGEQRPPRIRTEYLEQAEVRFREALAHYRALGDRYHESNTLHNLGYIQYVFGEESGERAHFEAALFHFEEAVALDRALGLRLPQRLNWLAATLAMLGEQERARELYGEALLQALRTRRLTEAMDILASIAVYIMEPGGRGARAVEALSLVLAHPATDARIRQWAGEQRALIEAALPAADAAQARAQARTLTLEEAAERVM